MESTVSVVSTTNNVKKQPALSTTSLSNAVAPSTGSVKSDAEFFNDAVAAAAAAAQIQNMTFASTTSLHHTKPASLRSKEKSEEAQESGDSASSAQTDIDASDRDDKHINVEKSLLGQMPMQRRILTMSALALSVFIGSLDQTIVASSMPAIAEHFDALPSVSWIATGFLLASTALQPLYGRLSDIFGRIETLLTGLLVFLAGSAVAGAASSIGMLIAGRVVQGLGASALISLVMVIVSDMTIERERPKITSVFATIWAASSVLGPVLGGLFTESGGGWRWVFYFSLPVGAVAGLFIAVFLRLPRPQGSLREKLRRVDFAGMVVLVGGIVMLLLGLSFGGGDYKWSSPTVICLLVFGVLVVAAFVLIEWKIPREPIMPLRLYRNRNVGLVLVMQLFVGIALFAPTFYIPIYFSVVHNSSAIVAGLHLLPYILPISIFSTISGFAVARTGRYREPIWIGAAITTVGIGLLALLSDTTTTGESIGLLLAGGIGIGLLMQPMLLALQTAIQPRDMACGTTLYVATRSLGGSLGLAVAQTVMQNKLAPRFVALYAQFPRYKSLIDQAKDNQAVIHSSDMPPELTRALVAAYVYALRTVFYAMIPFAAMILVLAVFMRHIPLRTRMATAAAE